MTDGLRTGRTGRTVRPTLAALGLGVLLAGCAGGAPGAGSEHGTTGPVPAAALECGLSTFEDGHQVVRYCGDGEARVTGQGLQAEVTGASCERRGEFLTANFGTNYSNEASARGHYVGLLLGDLPGAGRTSAPAALSGIEVILDGTRIGVTDATATVTLTDTRLEGTLKGTATDPVEITFHCELS